MRAILPPQPYTVKPPQALSSSRGVQHPVKAGPEPEQPKAFITGDLRMCVSESEAALRPIIGNFSIETVEMREPLYTLWHAEGKVLSRQAQSTNIVFDARGLRAGETQTYLVVVQVIEGGARSRAVQSGVFVQVEVTGDE
jgi:hypothetical protein